ncbi:MAG TPA: phospho-N-acetylmuramoyl-pentapeptide-transferase [Polyangia bacterium]|nr:phospho-N-acetylmuramoyl-pentapeptide-transferase [Polyangia bacterium]
MLYHLLYPLHVHAGLHGLNVLRYVSTRIIAATLTAMAISFLMGPWFINRLRSKQIGEQIRTDGPQTHKKKAGTPTMGGSLILFALVIPTLLWCDLTDRFIWLTLLVTIGYGIVGFIDDYRKLTRSKKGISGRSKIAAQLIIAAVAVLYLFYSDCYDPELKLRLALPLVDFYKHPTSLWLPVYIAFAITVIVGASNGVNMTDGLDGLAIGPVIISAGTFLILAYGAGTVIKGFNVAEYLKIPYIHGSGELAIFCGAMAGAGIGFLWFNTYPAAVFMGDVGSLSLGGALGMLAVLTKNEFTLLLVGGIFVVETLSVMVQVTSFKLTGKRVFKMAPIHHHFELKGWAEPKVIVRFWIISFMLALIALATLKVR